MSVRRLVSLVLVLGFVIPSVFAADVRELVPAAAPHGARVVITGVALDSTDLAVTFAAVNGGAASAVIVSRTETLVEAVVPAAAVSGGVRVITGGTTAATFAFSVLADPAFGPMVTSAASDQAHDVFKSPSAAAVALPSGSVCVADTAHHRITLWTPSGGLTVFAGTGKPGYVDGPAAQAQFKEPSGVAVDPVRQLLYVADTGNNVIRVVGIGGTVATLAGSGRPEWNDGAGRQASFKQPTGLVLDPSGNLYVADTGNSRIRRVTPAGVVTTVAGGMHAGLADGPASQALLNEPEGIAATAAGMLYVADTKNNVIRKIENGAVTTLAGTTHGGFVDGPPASAEFKEPAGIAVDDAGNLYVADTKNHAIRKVTPTQVSTVAGTGSRAFVTASARKRNSRSRAASWPRGRCSSQTLATTRCGRCSPLSPCPASTRVRVL